MEKTKNSELLNTAPKNDVTRIGTTNTSLSASTATAVSKTTDIYSSISQKSIFDKEKKETTEFVVFENIGLKERDWITKAKLLDILKSFNGHTITYELRKKRGNSVDEGGFSQSGKAVKFSVEGDIVKVNVYTQKPKSESWVFSHAYKMQKSVFDAYCSVIQNDEAVKLAEHEQKVQEATNLDLDESNEIS